MEIFKKSWLISLFVSGSLMANAADDPQDWRARLVRPKQNISQPYTSFENLCEDLAQYDVWSFQFLDNFHEGKCYGQDERPINGQEKEIAKELIALSENDVSKFLERPTKEKALNLSVLERLFYINLGVIAEEICDHFKSDLPPEMKTLLAIYREESVELPDDFSQSLGRVAYRVANQVGNYLMVEKICPLLGVGQWIENKQKDYPDLFSPEFNYIHSPYWSYNISQLKEYGKEIIKKITPYFIEKKNIKIKDDGKCYIQDKDKKVSLVRKVEEFGRILPLLYLQSRFEDEKIQALRVPRIYILPKHEENNITFTFKMSLSRLGDSGNNPLQVWSDDFDIYQEYIEGKGLFGSQSFIDYGHCDFNATQVIMSESGIRYLIDTKEQKNFFMPYFSPFSDSCLCDAHLKDMITAFGEKEMPDEKDMRKVFSKWQDAQINQVRLIKSLSFDPRVEYVAVRVSCKD